jgi:hypothetical protein
MCQKLIRIVQNMSIPSFSPFHSPSLGNDAPPYPPPKSSFPAVPPSASGKLVPSGTSNYTTCISLTIFHFFLEVPPELVKPPTAPPIIIQAPQQQALPPNTEHNNGEYKKCVAIDLILFLHVICP